MNTSFNRKIEAVLFAMGFVMAGLCAGAMVYMADDGRYTLDGIFRTEYLIPLSIYSAGVMTISCLLYHFIKKWMVKILAFVISVLFGIPIGLMLMNQTIKWSIYFNNWIDIFINTW
jgi:hypothetical protein